ncbi:DUF2306 domain-containing protein [uncultured Polaribacter sp.]|uniref:DUF2306 domain-containing protein n=1 Tax=uncultured Polaribacter sp. TaxID=174711 RepID=UPI0026309512|nr:DUF2306 domain-containing protein [uncultured Polaribacter sp.]
MKKIKKIAFYLLAIFATLIVLYPTSYLKEDRKFGLLQYKSDLLLADTLWNWMFYIHIICGAIALLIGWIQFHKKTRIKYMQLHRNIGKIYVVTVLISAVSGLYIAHFATGGLFAVYGFVIMSLIWFFTTLFAFLAIKKGAVLKHQKLMIYSYATCFAAVTLRIWLPIMAVIFKDFVKAYTITAWLSWVPNIIVAYFMSRKLVQKKE